jgi:hypothetical protein
VRWEKLWSDLESQVDAWERDDLEAEVADRVAIERASVLVMDRVRGSVGRPLRCEVAGGGRWQGVLLGYGVDWLLLGDDDGGRSSVLVPAGGLTGVVGLAERVLPLDTLSLVARRATLTMALRRLAGAAEPLRLHRGHSRPLSGRISVVGSDYVEVVDHDTAWVVPTTALVAVELSAAPRRR